MDNKDIDLNASSDDIPLGFSASILVENVSHDGDETSSSISRFSSGSSFLEKLKNYLPGIIRLQREKLSSGAEKTRKTSYKVSHLSLPQDKENCSPHPQKSMTKRSETSENGSQSDALENWPKKLPTNSQNSHEASVSQKTKGSMDNYLMEKATGMGGLGDKSLTESNERNSRSSTTKTAETSPSLHFFSQNEAEEYIIDEIAVDKTPKKSRKIWTGRKPSPATLRSQLCMVDEICEFSSMDIRSQWAESSENKLKGKQISQSSNVKEISEWAIDITGGGICIEGYIRGENGEPALFRTSCVTDVSDSGKTVTTFFGSRYKLLGNMLMKASIQCGVPINVANKFSKGFPLGWKKYCKWGANLDGSDSGSYQGDSSSLTQQNATHLLTSSEKYPRSLKRNLSSSLSGVEQNTEEEIALSPHQSIVNGSTSSAPDCTMSRNKDSHSTRKAKYANVLSPVPELGKMTDKSFSATPPRPSLSANTPKTLPWKQKSASDKKAPVAGYTEDRRQTKSTSKVQSRNRGTAEIKSHRRKGTQGQPNADENSAIISNNVATASNGSMAARRTRSGREVKPISALAKLALEFEKSAQKKSMRVSSEKKGTETPMMTQAAHVSVKKKRKIAGRGEKQKRKKRKSAKVLYTSNEKVDLSKPKDQNTPDGDCAIIRDDASRKFTSESRSDGDITKQNSSQKRRTLSSDSLKKRKQKPRDEPNSSRSNGISDTQIDIVVVRRRLDASHVPMTEIRQRFYEVPVTPLEAKETARKFLPKTSQDGKANKPANHKTGKSRGQKRSREDGVLARPRKRSRKSAKPSSGVLSPKTRDGCVDSDNVFNSPEMKNPKKSGTRTKNRSTTTKAPKEWTKYQRSKLKKFVTNVDDVDWEEISCKLGFPAHECEQVYTEIFRGKRKASQKEKKDSGPVEVTARHGTLKHREQVRQNLEVMKKPKFQDMFASEGVFATPVDNIFSADLFSLPGPSSDFIPVTPNTKLPVGLDSTVATPAWFKTPTSSGNMFESAWTSMVTAQTPAALKKVFSPQAQVGDQDEKRKIADRVIIQMQKKMMKGTLREFNDEKSAGRGDRAAQIRKKKRKNNNIDFDCVKDTIGVPDEEEDTDMDDYFNDSEG